MWDKFTVRLWAIKHRVKYREKVVRGILIGLSTFVLLCEVYCICFAGGLSVFGLLAVLVFGTLFAYTVLDYYKEKKNDNDKTRNH